ncbi:MAG: ABC transporter substrate-binding protein, partial [Bacteroidia bacterium]|nr:ABC transporter substrate-binding protein [Bacteroidia bacterium]
FTAQLIHDAGGDYIWKDDETNGSLILDFEIVLSKAGSADIWLNTGNLTTGDQILAMDGKLSAFNAFKRNEVYNPVNRMSRGGGNDFYESGSLRADLVLKDLHAIFMKDSTQELYYYKKI